MLFLVCHIGAERYALTATRVVEVIPFVSLQAIPRAPRGVAGLFNHRGNVVPAVDLGELLLGQPMPARLTTRIIVVRHAAAGGDEKLLGLIAGQVTETLQRKPQDFQEPALSSASPPFLGAVLPDERGLVRLIREDRLLPDEIRDALFAGEHGMI